VSNFRFQCLQVLSLSLNWFTKGIKLWSGATPGVNFINVFRAPFSYESAFLWLHFGDKKSLSYEKRARKTLMKLTTGEDQFSSSNCRNSSRKFTPGVTNSHDPAPAQERVVASTPVHGLAGFCHPEFTPLPFCQGKPRFSSYLLLITLKSAFPLPNIT